MMHRLNHLLKYWKFLAAVVLLVDGLVVAAILYIFVTTEAQRVAAAETIQLTPLPTATPTATATLWPGPGPSSTPTPTLPPTVAPTEVLAASGFPRGFTPTPRPTREKVMISLPYVYPVYRSNLDVPVINQIHYPEPFFPPGTNNACGPVALYAAFQALGTNVDYSRLRDVAVAYGFTSYGISKSGMVGTVARLNQELDGQIAFEHGNRYSTKHLIQQIRKGGVVIVLIKVRREGGRFRVTSDPYNSINHFLIVDSINLRSKTVRFAGSTLGMERVSLQEFIQSWGGNVQQINTSPAGWQSFLKNERANNWALIIRRKVRISP